jgi:glutathione-regulated potassium-efflux system protein KefB
MALALIAIKTAAIFLLALCFRMAWRGALALGLLLSQGGEFAFVLFAQGQDNGLISPDMASLFGAIVTLSMVSTPLLMAATRRFRQEPRRAESREEPQSDGASALVVGYGRFGQSVAQMLIAAKIPVTLIDTDVAMIDVAGTFGAKVYYGDGTRLDLLRQAGAAEATLIMFCIDRDQVDAHLAQSVKEAFPDAAIFVRAYDRRSLIALAGAPVAGTVREVLDSAVAMGRKALDHLGLDQEQIDQAEEFFRSRDRERLREQIASGDITTARERILTQPARTVPDAAPDQ